MSARVAFEMYAIAVAAKLTADALAPALPTLAWHLRRSARRSAAPLIEACCRQRRFVIRAQPRCGGANASHRFGEDAAQRLSEAKIERVPRLDQPLLVNGTVDYETLAAAEIGADVFGDVLASAWAAEYRLLVPAAELVEVDLGTLTYLFDLTAKRTLGVYGRSTPTTVPRPAARLRGHPSYNRPGQTGTDRGHLAAHTIGGGADINLVAQDHLLNVSGAWRSFERYA
jgi:hypothetical protein